MTYRRTVKVEPIVQMPERTYRSGTTATAGTVALITLDCGHVSERNPTMLHKVGDLVKCSECAWIGGER